MSGGIASTKGELTRAQIVEVNESRRRVGGGLSVPCMFNPFEYTLSKSNTFQEPDSTNGKNSPKAEFSKAGAQTLKLNLTFDTYEDDTDVREITDKLWKFMAVKKKENSKPEDKDSPPLVAFTWGTFYFVAYITNMTQKFTLFTHKGIPVRAKVDVTFTQYVDEEDYPPQNPTSGGGPISRIWRVEGGDRLDTIAAEVYGDATKWRLIAQHNMIINPLSIKPGQQLAIPYE
ncbi:MAG: LysM peptidoglycan-binding domain-containing protein [Caldilineaceae bacterium]